MKTYLFPDKSFEKVKLKISLKHIKSGDISHLDNQYTIPKYHIMKAIKAHKSQIKGNIKHYFTKGSGQVFVDRKGDLYTEIDLYYTKQIK